MIPRIFVGGIGRSGTTILNKALGCHKDIYSFPKEMRFLVDPHGLMNLVDALTCRYSPVQAREALYLFERMMRIHFATPASKPYPGYDFPKLLGEDFYWQQLDQFCLKIVDLEYSGASTVNYSSDEGRLVTWARSLQMLWQQLGGRSPWDIGLIGPRTRLKVVKYFGDRNQLISLAATFVDELFRHAASENSKQGWCEKTPHNHLNLPFLWELFPQSAIIIIKRDPRGVVYSLTRQNWAPNNVHDTCLYLRNIYERWFQIKNVVDLKQHRFFELKLEDLAFSPEAELGKIAAICGLGNYFRNLPNITLDKVNYWQKTMSTEDVRIVNDILSPYIEQMGYKV